MAKTTGRTRSLRTKSESQTAESATDRVMILPNDGNLFLMDQRHHLPYQLHKFVESPRSWFINDHGIRDGSIVFATPIDPLFLVLPYLKECDKFRPLDHVLVDRAFPDCNILLSCPRIQNEITSVADFKEMGDLRAYRYSESKCLIWLSAKVHNLVRMLKNKGIYVSSGAQAATFVRHKKDAAVSEEDYLKYAHGLISDYLPEDVAEVLLIHLGLTPTLPDSKEDKPEEPPKKRLKLDVEEQPVGDNSQTHENRLRPNTAKLKKLTATQKALKKVDKTGMKNISSFFSRKN